MKITLEFSDLTITIEAETLETACDAIMVGASTLKTLQELGHGKPKIKWNMTKLARR